MARRTPADRDLLTAKRLRSVLRAHGVATERTLEQKIADAGPGDQRIDPHVLTRVRAALRGQGEVIQRRAGGVPWYHLRTTPDDVVQERLAELQPIYARTRDGNFLRRVGQALEIAIFRALRELHAASPEVEFFGGFRDLEAHDDSRRYSRVEPDMISGEHIGGGWVDFVVTTPDGGRGAIEAKNKRQWIYPGRKEIAELLKKALALDAVPILIARRIPFVTFHLLSSCGVLFHQTYNQLYPEADAELATQAKDKRLLGYHDIRVGNQPDARLRRFIIEHLPRLLPAARERFETYRDLLEGYVDGEHTYEAFAARVRRRVVGQPEDGFEEEPDADWPEWEQP